MITPLLHRLRRVLPLSVAVLAMLGGASCSSSPTSDAVDYCATMPDSVGLYVGNPVTHLGYPIGEVASITPSAQSVRVNFKIDGGRTIPADAKAVTRSTSILADRALELVGDYEKVDHLSPGSCIPLSRSLTPKTLSEVIGAGTNFLNAINPAGSTNVSALVEGVDEAARGQGPNVNELLSTTSSVFDSPEQAIGDMASIARNLGQLTGTLNDLNPVTKQVFDELASSAGNELQETLLGADDTFEGIINVTAAAQGIEKELGPQVQQLLDAISVVVRKASPRAPFYASLLNVDASRAQRTDKSHPTTSEFGTLQVSAADCTASARPTVSLQCNIMNASMPGSCANVEGNAVCGRRRIAPIRADRGGEQMRIHSRLIATTVATAAVLSVSSCAAISVDALPKPGPSYDDGYDLVMQFESVLNLPERAQVVLDGVTVGVVSKVVLTDREVDVTARMAHGVVVPSDIHAVLQQATVLGDIYVALERPTADATQARPGTAPAPALAAGAAVPISPNHVPAPVGRHHCQPGELRVQRLHPAGPGHDHSAQPGRAVK